MDMCACVLICVSVLCMCVPHTWTYIHAGWMCICLYMRKDVCRRGWMYVWGVGAYLWMRVDVGGCVWMCMCVFGCIWMCLYACVRDAWHCVCCVYACGCIHVCVAVQLCMYDDALGCMWTCVNLFV